MTTAFVLAILLAQKPQPLPPGPTFEELLKRVAAAEADACPSRNTVVMDLEGEIFWKANEIVTDALRASSAASPKASAVAALQRLEGISAEINSRWPDDHRFHFEVVEVAPLLVVKMALHGRWRFSVFANTELGSDEKSPNWHSVDNGVEPGEFASLDVFPLDRGPAKKARFLARFMDGRCVCWGGVDYAAYEWDPHGLGVTEIIKVAGVHGGRQERFGEFQAHGSLVTLPYCWNSAIDWWVNPTMCAVESYDVSGDHVRFVSLVVNHPDWLPIVRAIQYAQAHDYPAVRAYCGSAEIAWRLVSIVPAHTMLRGQEPAVDITGPATETLDLGGARFEVEKREGRWLVVGFRMD